MSTRTETILLEPLPAEPVLLPALESTLEARPPSLLRKVAVPILLASITFLSSASNGLVVIGLPKITEDLNLPSKLAFWPASVGSLATASTLLLAGSIADVIGPKKVDVLGSTLSGVVMLISGFVKTGEQLVALRAFQGVGLALHLSSAVALVAKILSRGRERNMAFAVLGLSQPLGFCFGIVIGGVLVDTIGWRSGWYFYGGTTLLLSVTSFWSLPKSAPLGPLQNVAHALRTQVDWVGAILASAFMALLCYFLAYVARRVPSQIATGNSMADSNSPSDQSAPMLMPRRSREALSSSVLASWRCPCSSPGDTIRLSMVGRP